MMNACDKLYILHYTLYIYIYIYIYISITLHSTQMELIGSHV